MGMNEDLLYEILVDSRGLIQCIDDIIKKKAYKDQRQRVSFENKRRNPSLLKLWEALLKCIEQAHQRCYLDVLNGDKEVTDIPPVRDMVSKDSELQEGEMWDWVDYSFLSLTERDNEHYLCFSNLSDFLWAVYNIDIVHQKLEFSHGSTCDKALTSKESSCLQNPANTELHEELFAECLAVNYSYFTKLKGYPTVHEHVFQYKSRAICHVDDLHDPSRWNGDIFKIYPGDGVDLVPIHQINANGRKYLRVTLIQCKFTMQLKNYLCVSSTKETNLLDINRKINIRVEEIKQLFRGTGLTLLFHNLLATTLLVSDTTRKEANNVKLKIIDMRKMWTPRIQQALKDLNLKHLVSH